MNNAEYYSNPYVCYEIVKYMRNREIAFLQKLGAGFSFRNIKVNNIAHLHANFERWEIHKNPFNIYQSTALLKDMPVMSFQYQERMRQSKEFHQNFNNYVTAYDFIIDIDLKDDFQETYEQTNTVHEMLEEIGVCHYIKFSGGGFNIVIPHTHLDIDVAKLSCMQQRLLKLANAIKEVTDAALMDTTIYIPREVTKVPFTLDNKRGTVCLPLTKTEFENFNHSLVHPETFLKTNFVGKGITLINETKMDAYTRLVNHLELTEEDFEAQQEQDIEQTIDQQRT